MRFSTERKIHGDIRGVIGSMPLVRLVRVAHSVVPPINAKLAHLNSDGSIRGRAGPYINEQAEKRGELKPDGIREVSPENLLPAKSMKTLSSASLGDQQASVMMILRQNGISQMPVVGEEGMLARTTRYAQMGVGCA